MSKTPYTAPYKDGKAFNCPKCNAYANQRWSQLIHNHEDGSFGYVRYADVSFCGHCGEYSIWVLGKMIYPDVSTTEQPSEHLPDDVRQDYEEAASIVNKSPRSAAALLRLAIAKLSKHLGETGKDLNTDIKNLVKNGLPSKIQQALDTVRVVGNHSVHAGEINLNDDPQTAAMLFRLVNIIAEKMIGEPKEIDDIYASLPVKDKESIAKRDGETAV